MRLATKALHQTHNREAKDAYAADSKDAGPEVNSDYGGGADEEKAQSKYSSSGFEGYSSSSAKGTGAGAAAPKSTAGTGSGAQHKPAWAMTEQAADVQDDELRMEEENELLDFARGLDFDKYVMSHCDKLEYS